jgi:hypothetical protein
MIKVIEPEKIICYGNHIDGMDVDNLFFIPNSKTFEIKEKPKQMTLFD